MSLAFLSMLLKLTNHVVKIHVSMHFFLFGFDKMKILPHMIIVVLVENVPSSEWWPTLQNEQGESVLDACVDSFFALTR